MGRRGASSRRASIHIGMRRSVSTRNVRHRAGVTMGTQAVRVRKVMPGEHDDIDFDAKDTTDIDVLHEIGSRFAAADPLHAVWPVVDFVSSIVPCDSCFLLRARGGRPRAARIEDAASRRGRSPEDAPRAGDHRVGCGASPAGGRRPRRLQGSALPDVQRAAGGSLRGLPVGAGAVARQAGRRHQPAASAAARLQPGGHPAHLDDRVPRRRRDRDGPPRESRTRSCPSASRRGRSSSARRASCSATSA